MSNKFAFIKSLLENEKFDVNQKERFFKLVARELESSTKSDEQLIQDINKIKDKLGMVDKPGSFDLIDGKMTLDKLKKMSEPNNELEVKYNWVPTYINPNGIYKYLFDYNNNLILKSTCHKIDSDELKIINNICGTETYNFNKHLTEIIEAFEIHDKKYAPGFIKTFVRLYLTGKDFNGNKIGTIINDKKLGWTEDTISFCWSDVKLKTWAENNKGLPPCPSDGLAKRNQDLGYELENSIKNSYQRNLSTFSKLVLHFKKMFHIKSDNSLKSIINQQNKLQGWCEKIDFLILDDEFPSNIELFTYVERVIQAYKSIIRLIIEKSKEKPTVKLTFREDKEAVYFTIHHLNNQFSKTSAGILERLHGQTYKNMIISQINGLCDLFVEAELENNEFIKFNVWDENYKSKKVDNKNVLIDKYPIKISQSEKSFKGVTHILRFKKK
mgnify:CR=1 FL=1